MLAATSRRSLAATSARACLGPLRRWFTPGLPRHTPADHGARGRPKRWRHVLDAGGSGLDSFRCAVTAAFRLLDKDGNGELSRIEMIRGLAKYELVQELLQLPPTVSAIEFEEMYEAMGTDERGCVTEAAWTEFFMPTLDEDRFPPPKPYDPRTSRIRAFLIDLDGTIYSHGALIPGARTFYKWLRASGMPYVFLSNTGAKGPEGTQARLATEPFKIDTEPVPLSNIWTAADAQADYMVRSLPPRSKLLVVSGGGSFWRTMLDRRDAELVSTWQIEEQLTDAQAMEWAVEAERCRAAAQAGAPAERVAVAFFLDGDVRSGSQESGWNYGLIKQCAFLLGHGADLIYTADDPFNPSSDKQYGRMVFPLPGPGMFASMLRPVLPLGNHDQFLCCGKGGNVGRQFMMEHAIEMLRAQGHDGDRDTIMMVGDRFGTDVRGAVHVGIKSCLVESGCERAKDRVHYPTERATFVAPSVDYIHLLDRERGAVEYEREPGRP